MKIYDFFLGERALTVFLAMAFLVGFLAVSLGFAVGLILAVGLGGGAVGFPIFGGTARIKHFGPEPMRSSRCAFINASRTK